jgi:hypothetical protein
VDGGTARQPQQRDCGDDQGQLKIGITTDNHISSHWFAVFARITSIIQWMFLSPTRMIYFDPKEL